MQQPPPLPPLNPYAAPVARVDDFDPGELVLAGRGVRLAATIIDNIIILAPVMLIAVLLPAFVAESTGEPDTAFALVLIVGLGAMLAIIVYNCVLLHRNGQTIAKRLFGIKVVRSDGTPCALSRIVFARWLPVTVLTQIPFLGVVVALVDALMIFREDQRCLHDLIADTIVVVA